MCVRIVQFTSHFTNDLSQKYTNITFLEPMISSMTQKRPQTRPTAAGALKQLNDILSAKSRSSLRRRLRSTDETFVTSIAKDARVARSEKTSLHRPAVCLRILACRCVGLGSICYLRTPGDARSQSLCLSAAAAGRQSLADFIHVSCELRGSKLAATRSPPNSTPSDLPLRLTLPQQIVSVLFRIPTHPHAGTGSDPRPSPRRPLRVCVFAR